MDRIIIMPLIGSIDSLRAREITRTLLAGIREQRAKVVILDVTGVPIVDSGVANHLNKTIQAARLKGAQAIVTGISTRSPRPLSTWASIGGVSRPCLTCKPAW